MIFFRAKTELKRYNNAVDYYLTMGHPRYEAEELAYEYLYRNRLSRKARLEVY